MKFLSQKNIKKLFTVAGITGILYLSFLFVLPLFLNSHFILNKAKAFLHKETKMTLDTQNIKFKTYPDLKIGLVAKKLALNDKSHNNLITVKNADILYDLKHFKTAELIIDYIYIDEQGFRDILKENSKKHASDFSLHFVPRIKVNKIEIWVDRKNDSSVFVIIRDVIVKKDKKDKKTYCTFNAEVISNLLQNILEIGNNGYIYVESKGIFADNLEFSFGPSVLTIDGKLFDNNKLSDCTVKGEKLPVNDIQAALLYFLKKRKTGKQFMENFYDYAGEIDVDLVAKDNGVYGRCTANDLSAKSRLFDVPIFFDKVFFDFNDREVNSEAEGTLGGEKVFNTFHLINMATDEQEVSGHVNSVINDNVAVKYIPETRVKGGADATVDYKVKNHIINVDYLLKLGKNSDIIYKGAYMGRTDKDRQILINTVKDNDKITITHYDYSDMVNGVKQTLISGDGLFLKQNGTFTFDKITMQTNGYVPATITGSFGEHIEGGIFSGNLTYYFNKELLLGDFTVKDTSYRNFYIKDAVVDADEDVTTINANGTFKNTPFDAHIKAKSSFTADIHVYDLLMHLTSLNIKPTQGQSVNANSIAPQVVKKIQHEVKYHPITVDKWTVKIDKLSRERITLKNVEVTGNVKNRVFNFVMVPLKFAGGTLKANGFYNFKTKCSEIDFEAIKVDSNRIATVLFNFPDQIEGIANAKVRTITNNGTKNFKAFVDFSIDNGLLTKIGSTEFIIKKSKKGKHGWKLKLEDFITIDVKYMDALYSDLKGKFIYENSKIHNAEITSKQKYFSYIMTGDYDIDSGYADFELFGTYNDKVQNKVKVFFIPLSVLTKVLVRSEHTYERYKDILDKVPPILATENEKRSMKVVIKGNLNHHPSVKIRAIRPKRKVELHLPQKK